MIYVLAVLGYFLVAGVAHRVYKNIGLTKWYNAYLKQVNLERAASTGRKYTESAEETALRLAQDKVNYSDDYTFGAALVAWFWPIAIAGYSVYWVFKLGSKLFTFKLFQSKPEKIVAKQRIFKENEEFIKSETARLKKLAKELEISTKGLDAL